MRQPFWQKIFNPGSRGRLRWALLGILVLFAVAAFIDLIGFKNQAAEKIDQGLSAVPVASDLKIWPLLQKNSADNSRTLVWKSIRQIDLTDYGWSFRLGLDLLGGTHLIYEADTAQISATERGGSLDGVRDVIERRVNALGVSEPVVQTNQVGDSWRVIVELAGVYDVNQAIKIIGETPLLQFKEENPDSGSGSLTLDQQKQLDQANQEAQKTAQGVLDQILKSGAKTDWSVLAKQYSEDPGSQGNGGLYTAVKKGVFVPEFDDVIFNKLKMGEIYPQLVKTQFGYHIIKKEGEQGAGDNLTIDTRHILFKIKTAADLGIEMTPEWQNTELTGRQLTKAVVEIDRTSGLPQVALTFNDEGKKLFGEITQKNVGKLVAIFLDGQPISIPRVSSAITSGQAVISGSFPLSEARILAQRLNAGALPVPIKLISQTTVGASLGNESMQKSLAAGLWGLLLVAIFMILFYRLPGVLSVMALLIYTAISLVLFKFFITLTLAGIAGFILSIGMAVDANVLIFERLKEELKRGRDLASAVDEGFRRAWSSIRDSNVSSLITCGILFWFGSSIIKGFALTLALGILVSMFSAVVITRQFLRLVVKWRIFQWSGFYGVKIKK